MADATVLRGVLNQAGVTDIVVEELPMGTLVRLPSESVSAALSALKASDSAYTFLVDLFGSDTGELVEITYHVRSFSRAEDLYLRAQLPYDGVLASAWEIFPSALMPERETAEMFGLALEGHPNPKRLLTTDAVGPLLRKSVQIRTAEEVRAR